MSGKDGREIEKKKKEWEETCLKPALKRFGAKEPDARFYTPLDVREFDFLEKVGFPGEYPYTAGTFPAPVPGAAPQKGAADMGGGGGLVRAGRYSGYGTVEDTRDYFLEMRKRGWRSGPRLAFDLPTQNGYDSDDPTVVGEVGGTGVAIDTLADMETLYEAFTGEYDLDKTASVFVINATSGIIMAMYAALAEKRGIPLNKMRATPQNDILKEMIARGNYIWPPKPSMRLTRDVLLYCNKHMPLVNSITINVYHIREAGASRPQALGFGLSNGIAYMQLGVDAGLDVDSYAYRINFGNFSGSMEMYKEVALRRAARRMWAKIMRERFGAKDPKSWLLRTFGGAMAGCYTMTVHRPLNNLTRSVLGGVACAMVGDYISCEPPYDEALGLGWSLEAQQLVEDASRILHYEAKLSEVIDPWAGSYFMESLTDQIEEETWEVIRKIDSLGGAAAAIEQGYMQREMAKSAHQYQQEIETGKRIVVGVNAFADETELEVLTTRVVDDPYDPKKRATCEARQIARLKKVKAERDNAQVRACLKRLEAESRDEKANMMYPIVEAVKAYVSIGEICG
ncbi:MAG: methylmalonyl-CoA mutase family protein, partial [Chloroflexota bacterium]